MANPPGSSTSLASSSDSSHSVGFTVEQQRIIEALSKLLTVMLKREDVVYQVGIFELSSDEMQLGLNIANLIAGGEIHYPDLSVIESADLVKRLLRELRASNVSFFIDESKPLEESNFNQDPQVQDIIKKLVQLLRKIAYYSKTNQMDAAYNLSKKIAPNMFEKIDYEKDPTKVQELTNLNYDHIDMVEDMVIASDSIFPEMTAQTMEPNSSSQFILASLSPTPTQPQPQPQPQPQLGTRNSELRII